jgi:HAD superfamily hydrolase (TIGR01549 family)
MRFVRMTSVSPFVKNKIKGVVFDMDGTLTLPGLIDFARIRSRLGISAKDDIIGHMRSIEDPIARQVAHDIVAEEEAIAIENTALCEGVDELIHFLDSNAIPKALLTRNAQPAVDVFLSHSKMQFDVALTRDFEKGFKPDPAPLLHIADQWGIEPQHLLMVGDAKDDIICGNRAGYWTCLVHYHASQGQSPPPDLKDITIHFEDTEGVKHAPHLVLNDIRELKAVLEENTKQF